MNLKASTKVAVACLLAIQAMHGRVEAQDLQAPSHRYRLVELGTLGGRTERPVKQKSNHIAEATIAVRIYDFAGLEPIVLADAKKVTTEIFRKAGVEAVWLDCPVDRADCGEEPERLQFMLRILSTVMKKDLVEEDSLGFAIPCHEHDLGCLQYIFYSRIGTLAAGQRVGPGRVLGHVMAHELGHGLLGPDAHEAYGIMQAKFPISDLAWKTFYFTSAQSKRLRTELLMREPGTEER
jgi:hypothetical protein